MNSEEKSSVQANELPEIVKSLIDGSFNSESWLKLFRNGNYSRLSGEFIVCLNHYRSTTFYNLDIKDRITLNCFVESFLFLFCNPRFSIPQEHLEAYLQLGPIITNAVAISDFETTTPWIIPLVAKRENYFKVLSLLNPRVQFDIDQNILFDISDYFSSEWWSYYWLSVTSYCRRDTWQRIRFHLVNLHPKFILFGPNAKACYFPSTYVAPELDHIVKSKLNDLAKTTLANIKISNTPSPKKIAFITGRWYRSAVYTSLAPMIHSLKGHYEITLIHLGAKRDDLKDSDMFNDVINIFMMNNQIDMSAVQENSFNIALYPDVGMSSESVFLSNMRIAPIQIMMYGHPSSTRGSYIDYFIVGKQSENLSLLSANYSERPVVLPGLGVNPVFPEHVPLSEYIETADSNTALRINCPWTSQKITWPLIDMLIDIIRQSRRKIEFCFFSGGGLTGNNSFIPFAKDIWNLLGQENVRLFPPIKNDHYIEEMNKGTFSLDSYPFGGFNTIIDSLHCKKPIITWKGDFAYNRFAASTLELLGLQELIVTSRDAYIDLTLKMIHDCAFRKSITEKICAMDIKKKIMDNENPAIFLKAIDYLCLHHDTLKNDREKNPIFIE